MAGKAGEAGELKESLTRISLTCPTCLARRAGGLHCSLFHKCDSIYEMEALFEQ